MKIAYISPVYFSDVDLSYLSHAQKELDITYFAPIIGGRTKGAAYNLPKQSNSYGIFSASSTYPELEKYGHLIDLNKFFVINSPAKKMWNIKNILLHLKLAWQLRKFDIIHITEFPKYYEWFLYFLRKKIVLTVHDPIPHSTVACNTTQIKINRKIAFKVLNNFIILNKNQKDEFIRTYNLIRKNIFESRLGRYDYLTMYKSQQKSHNKYILFFGQIASNKGLDILFPAMEELHKTFPNIKLISAGRGQYPLNIEQYENLEYFDIRNRFIPDQELAELIQNAMFVVCPYKDATQSGVVMSAFAFNKPVVATNVGGFPEQVIHNKYGLIIPPCNVSQLSQALQFLCTDSIKLEQFSKNIQHGYEFGENSWSHIVSQMKTLYISMI
jgi:glycosyltransferase involved in cell wall biosynthesis